ncbi:MAG TPA: hypothetical protein VG366_04415 [Solirubrobacteraceae bacterium]|nr:hypothetical protein [Solirubrobacteraceae bacterium]
MATDRQSVAAPSSAYPAGARAGHLTGGGSSGNARLTAAAGVLLLAPLAVIGVTMLDLRGLLSVHLFVGMLLIPPVLLKMGTTGYRFFRYYSANAVYRRKGPPPMLLRLIAPMVILSTLVVLGTGVALLFLGPSSRGELLPIHKISFFVWAAFAGVHLLGHMLELPEELRADYGRSASTSGDITGRSGRVLALSGALVAGAVLAILVIPEFGAWLHSSDLLHHHG